jgi:hypothetical protein
MALRALIAKVVVANDASYGQPLISKASPSAGTCVSENILLSSSGSSEISTSSSDNKARLLGGGLVDT